MQEISGEAVQASNTTFNVVKALSDLGSGGVTDIANRLDLPKSTTYNHLNTLVDRGYAVKEEEEYRLSMQFLRLGNKTRRQRLIYQVARDDLVELADRTDVNAYLTVEELGQGVIIYREMADEIDLGDYVGQSMQLTSTAAGKAILAAFDDHQVAEILDRQGLPRMTDHTLTDRASLFDELENIRDRGYSLGREEQVKGLRSIGAAITAANGDVLGAVSIAGPKQQLQDDRFQKTLPEIVLSTVNVIELKLIQ